MAFEYLQGWRFHHFSGQLMLVVHHPHRREVFPKVQRTSAVLQSASIVSCPVAEHQWKQSGSIFFAPSLQAFIYMSMIPLSLLFSRLNSPSQSFLVREMIRSPHALCGPLLDSLVCPSLSCMWESRTGHRTPGMTSSVLSRGEGSPPFTCWQYFV